MLKHLTILAISFSCAIFTASAIAKSSSEYLKEYQNIVDNAHKQAITSIPPAKPPTPPSIATGQAALVPIQPKVTPQPHQEQTWPTETETNQSKTAQTEHNTKKPNNAGPPNIFITPGGNSNSESVIRYN